MMMAALVVLSVVARVSVATGQTAPTDLNQQAMSWFTRPQGMSGMHEARQHVADDFRLRGVRGGRSYAEVVPLFGWGCVRLASAHRGPMGRQGSLLHRPPEW